jgi:subtilisin family serine protease
MKKKSMVITGIWLLLIMVNSCNPVKETGLFYYGTKEKIPLSVSPNRIIIKYVTTTEVKVQLRKLEQYGKPEIVNNSVVIITLSDSKAINDILKTIKSEKDVVSANPIYITIDKQEMGVTDEICLEFNNNFDAKNKPGFFEKYKAVEVTRTNPWEKYFTIITIGKDQNALEVANKIKESGQVKFSQPNFYAMTYMHALIPNDQFFPNQFFLNNTGQATNDGHVGTADADIDAPEAWDISTGSNTITIAVIDEGVERTNNDLPTARLNIINGSNFASGSANDPDAAGDGAHGTCCAGIIGAQQGNLEGVSGIAPQCIIMPVRIPFGIVPDATYANAINFAWQNGADVLSNSWGYSSTVDRPVITAAINNAITMGRGATGSVVVWSAGNTANHNNGNNGIVTYPGNVAVANVITVGASDRNDNQANYSPTSADVDVVAPSHRAYSSQIAGESFEVWSTDIIANAGYNSTKQNDGGALPVVGAFLPSAGTNFQDYTGRMGGTSAACPEVSGVAALILSLHPTYTPAQVFNIITGTADKVGGFTYAGGRCNEMGFGRLNAFNAISAQLWMQDSHNDPGTEPNNTGDLMYLSDDIWVRKTNDGIQMHEDAEYKTSSPNSVYVRIRNAGADAGSATIKLYWAKASSGLSWPSPWDGSVTVPALMGGLIDSKPTGMIPAMGESIIQFDWYPPDPALYSSFGPDQFHFCLLARIETSNTPPYGMTFPETGNLGNNVMNNNNIVWKNMSVKDNVAGDAGLSGMLVANYSKREQLMRIAFTIPRTDEKYPLFKYGALKITLSDKLYKKWEEAGEKSNGVKVNNKGEFLVTGPDVWIGDFKMKPKEIYGLHVTYKLNNKPDVKNLKDFAFNFDVQQLILVKDKWQVDGGQRFQYYLLKREPKK